MNNEVNIKNLVIVERPLGKSVLKKVDIKQIPKPQCLFNRNTDIDNFVSPYARKITPNDINSKIKPVINGCKAKIIDARQHLNDNRDKNSPIDGWSASDIAKYRNEIQNVFKPETIEAIKNLSRKKTTEKKSIDSQLLSKIAEACREKPLEEKENEEMEVDDDDNKNSDVSFLPINPNNDYVNMNKLEMNKLEWMKYIDVKAEKSKLKSIRFHVTGIGLSPEEDDEELMEKPSGDFDPFQESLQHHGDEPHRKGYTISELFWLARSSFLMQRSVAVSTLTNMLRKSSNLEHVYHFNLPTVTQSLVDCGIVFLARWLIDDAGEREQHLYQALDLMHAIVWNVNESNCDNVQFDWPNSIVGLNLSPMKDKIIAEKHLTRLGMPISERTEIKDDILLAEDLISCLVSNTYFLDRFSFLLVTKRIPISLETSDKFIEILQRIVVHSVDMATKLCNDHESLLSVLINTHLLRRTECTGNMAKLIRYLCQSSQSLAHKLTRDQKIIKSLYTFITEYDRSVILNNNTETSAIIECIRLVTVLLHSDIHIGPITTIMPSLLDQLNQMITNHYTSSPICRAILTCFTAFICSKAIITDDLYSVIKSSIITVQEKLLDSLQSPESHHPLLASMLHLINKFVTHQYNRQDSSCFTVASNLWHNLVSHLLISPLLDSLLMKLSDFCVLGYEQHSNSTVELINLDLTNMLHNSCRIAVKTRNPKFIDVNPFFIEMNPSFSLLSAISHTISLMASTRVSLRTLNNSNLISNFDAIPHLTKFITKIANCRVEEIVSTSPHSVIVQLQLEAISQFIISVVDISQWANTTLNSYCSTILYKAAIKLLPYFGPRLYSLAINLLNKVVFNPSIIESMKIPVDSSVTQLLLSSISTVRQTYEACFPSFQSINNKNNNNALSINDFFVPFNWIDHPFIKQFKQQQQKSDSDPADMINLTFSANSITALIAYVSVLETGLIITDKIIPITGIRRLYHLFITNDWLDNFWEQTPRLIITSFVNRYLSNISLIDLSSKQTDFFDLYNSFCEQYFSQSFCDPLFANLIMFPCAMRFPLKFRKTFWNINFDNMRLVTMEIGESIVAIGEYLQPEEVDHKMIQFYFELLKNESITESHNELLYWICIHHLNRFVFNRSLLISADKFILSLQRGLIHLLTNPHWQNRTWIKHVRFYKHFVGSAVEFYDELPVHRLEHLSKLQQLADVTFAEKSL